MVYHMSRTSCIDNPSWRFRTGHAHQCFSYFDHFCRCTLSFLVSSDIVSTVLCLVAILFTLIRNSIVSVTSHVLSTRLVTVILPTVLRYVHMFPTHETFLFITHDHCSFRIIFRLIVTTFSRNQLLHCFMKLILSGHNCFCCNIEDCRQAS